MIKTEEYYLLNFCKLEKEDIEFLISKVKQMQIIDRINFINKIIDVGDENIASHPNFKIIFNCFNQEISLGNCYIKISGDVKDKLEIFNFLRDIHKYEIKKCHGIEYFIDIGNKCMTKTYFGKLIEIDKYKFYAIFDRGYKRRDTIKDLLND